MMLHPCSGGSVLCNTSSQPFSWYSSVIITPSKDSCQLFSSANIAFCLKASHHVQHATRPSCQAQSTSSVNGVFTGCVITSLSQLIMLTCTQTLTCHCEMPQTKPCAKSFVREPSLVQEDDMYVWLIEDGLLFCWPTEGWLS